MALKCLPAPLLASPLFTLARLAAQAWGALTHRGAAGQLPRRSRPWRSSPSCCAPMPRRPPACRRPGASAAPSSAAAASPPGSR
ncbi:MAG: hypothetical protein U0802_08485 [Candidatus Binatia bacterium]